MKKHKFLSFVLLATLVACGTESITRPTPDPTPTPVVTTCPTPPAVVPPGPEPSPTPTPPSPSPSPTLPPPTPTPPPPTPTPPPVVGACYYNYSASVELCTSVGGTDEAWQPNNHLCKVPFPGTDNVCFNLNPGKSAEGCKKNNGNNKGC